MSKRKIILLLIIGICLAVFIGINVKNNSKKKEPVILTTSALKDTINIAELSSAEFIYNGIAEIYYNNNPDIVECYVKYYARVKAGINMTDVTFDIDNEKKIIRPKLPEIAITSNIVDSKELDFIPSKSKVELKVAIKACEEDARKEATATKELHEKAKESLEGNIQALLYPIVRKQGYTILWE